MRVKFYTLSWVLDTFAYTALLASQQAEHTAGCKRLAIADKLLTVQCTRQQPKPEGKQLYDDISSKVYHATCQMHAPVPMKA